jgi:dihydrofolate synthase/folylpolyglutamate synthase
VTLDSYADVLTYFYSYARYNPNDVTRWSLDRLKGLLARLGNPHQRYPSILIAGTKGKGSTSAMCESILRHAGYKTGLYTSPHLHSFRERIQLDGQLIDEGQLVALANELKPHFEATPGLTAFELITSVALMAFARANIDAAVLEVGLGGRLDATNAVDPTVAVITSISYDHMKILGDTLTLIAGEKAGIIRPGATVISAPQMDEALAKIEQVCQEKQAHLIVVDRDWRWEVAHPTGLEAQTFTVCDQTYHLPLLGEHQVANAVTALATIQHFSALAQLLVSKEALQAGLAQVQWRGRLEVLSHQPYLVVDSAMNGDSAEKLVRALQRYFPGYRITFIFGASNDHPVKDMLKVFLPAAQRMIVTASIHPRAERPETLAVIAAELGAEVMSAPDAPQALEQALTGLPPDGLVCAAGSLFLVADVREAWLRRNGLPLPPIDPIVKQD